MTTLPQTIQQSSRWLGARTANAETIHSLNDMVDRTLNFAEKERFAKTGERIVNNSGAPLGVSGATKKLRVTPANFAHGRQKKLLFSH